jgi:hypothetical protein
MNGMSEESRNNIVKGLAAFQMDHFDDSIGSEIQSNDFDSAKNPFLDSPKKASTKLPFPKPADMFMSSKGNRYDVFKDEFVSNGHENGAIKMSSSAPAAAEVHEKKTEMSQDPFKDFAAAAFSEFKVDKSSSSLHEFSNKLFQQPNSNGHLHQRTSTKVKKQTHISTTTTTTIILSSSKSVCVCCLVN